MAGDDAADALVHGPLARWAARHPGRTALEVDGRPALDFAALHARVLDVAARLHRAQVPAERLVPDDAPPAERLVELLGTLHAGRCAAIGDPAWPAAVRAQVAGRLDGRTPDVAVPRPDGPFYIGFTSGSTGVPKGFRRSHRSWVQSFRACVDTFGDAARGPVLVPGAWSSSLALFGMLLGLWGGGGIGVLTRFSAPRLLAVLAAGQPACVVAVPSQLIALLALARRRGQAPMTGVRLLLIGGARWPAAHTAGLRALFPNARCITFYGASEASFVTWQDLAEPAPEACVGRPFQGVEVQLREVDAEGVGRLHVRSPMLFDGYVGAGAASEGVARDAEGWLALDDLGRFDAAGRLLLAGRRQRVIVTGGLKVHAEQVEACLAAVPGVAAVSVQALPDDWRGAVVVAVVQRSEDATDVEPDDAFVARLLARAREALPPHACPRRVLLRADWPLTAAGKTDHPAIARDLAAAPPA